MEISRAPAGLPPTAREEIAQRQRNGRGGDSGGDPAAERRPTAERTAADWAGTRTTGLQTTEAVGRVALADAAGPVTDAMAMTGFQGRGARLDLRI